MHYPYVLMSERAQRGGLERRSPQFATTSWNGTRLGALALAAALAGGCGYHFAAAGSGLPASAQTIYVDNFPNRSRITGLNDQFARCLKDEIASHKRLKVVDDPARADLSLSGEILTAEERPTTFNAVDEPTQFQTMIAVRASLRDNRTRKIVWRTGRLGGGAFYAVVQQAVVATSPQFLQQNLRQRDISQLPDIQLAQTQRESAQGQYLTSLAHNLYANMSEGF